jgi:hypothetical protein
MLYGIVACNMCALNFFGEDLRSLLGVKGEFSDAKSIIDNFVYFMSLTPVSPSEASTRLQERADFPTLK